MKLVALALLLSFSLQLHANGVCSAVVGPTWEKMDEDSFSQKAALEQLIVLNELFKGNIKVTEEFIHQSNLVLEGAFYRMEMDTWEGDPEQFKHAKERFCKFMAERAYLVH